MDIKQILKGIKIADFSWVIAGPTIIAEMAAFGAEVIHSECHRFPETGRTIGPYRNNKPMIDGSAWYSIRNYNKYGISLDLNKPKGQEVGRRMVKWADIVCESMSPGNMKRWGLDYESCKKIKPDIIYISTCQFGQQGPYAQFAGYGQLGGAYAGFSYVLGNPGKVPPQLYNNYPDFITPPYIVSTVLACLLRRRKTGEGAYIDGAQVEAGVNFMGPAILDYQVNGRIAERMGTHDLYMSPHAVYPARGQDRWVAITVSNEEEWRALVKAMGSPEWCSQPKFASFASRKENEDELDSLISAWTVNFTSEHMMQLLQDAGVPAGIVAAGEDLLSDPQLKYRNHYVYLKHGFIGEHAYHTPAYRLSRTPHRMWKAAPCMGEDNLFVYRDLLGLSEEEISTLMAEGVITTEADMAPMKPYR